jgi:hypothetical protein
MGWWRKPVAYEVDPEDDREARALAARGWRVKVFGGMAPFTRDPARMDPPEPIAPRPKGPFRI